MEEAIAVCEESTLRVMMYMFPRQFGLHNVFTSNVDHSQTAQKFQDYTLREEEITTKFAVVDEDKQRLRVQVPKRLRGLPRHLIQRLQILHARCSYSELLQHYCSVRSSACYRPNHMTLLTGYPRLQGSLRRAEGRGQALES